MIRLPELRVPLPQDQDDLRSLAAAALRVPPPAVAAVHTVRKSLDARRKAQIKIVYTLDVDLQPGTKLPPGAYTQAPAAEPGPQLSPGSTVLTSRPVVIGAGPAGLFAALVLAEHGYRPLVLERGAPVEEREQDIARFWETGTLDPESNVQFGEGGAGTFSDGKLLSRIRSPWSRYVFSTLIAMGAPPSIAYDAKPHIGTDILRTVVKNIRAKLFSLGGEVAFRAKLTDLVIEQGRLTGVVVNGTQTIPAGVVVLATGHSARDIYALLHRRGVHLEPKAFAMGVRVEHPQDLIDRAQYGQSAGHPRLGAADYQLVHQSRQQQRAAYTFCMCPGGYVIGAASEAGGVVTNGMSNYARDSGIANSAVVVTVSPPDFPGPGPLAGLEFQRQWESKAFTLGGGGYKAPAQTVGDFLKGKTSGNFGTLVRPTYRPGVIPADLHACLPAPVAVTLREALPAMGQKIRGFDHPEALLTGVETRTSAPLRILRDENRQSVSVAGLYPAGEGAGYAGGITSAAVDGIEAAAAIIARYRPPRSEED